MLLYFCADIGLISYQGNTLDDIQCLFMYPNQKHALSHTYLNKYSFVFCADMCLVTYEEQTLDNMQCLHIQPNKTLQNITCGATIDRVINNR